MQCRIKQLDPLVQLPLSCLCFYFNNFSFGADFRSHSSSKTPCLVYSTTHQSSVPARNSVDFIVVAFSSFATVPIREYIIIYIIITIRRNLIYGYSIIVCAVTMVFRTRLTATDLRHNSFKFVREIVQVDRLLH
jgi:hypothetical protein